MGANCGSALDAASMRESAETSKPVRAGVEENGHRRFSLVSQRHEIVALHSTCDMLCVLGRQLRCKILHTGLTAGSYS